MLANHLHSSLLFAYFTPSLHPVSGIPVLAQDPKMLVLPLLPNPQEPDPNIGPDPMSLKVPTGKMNKTDLLFDTRHSPFL